MATQSTPYTFTHHNYEISDKDLNKSISGIFSCWEALAKQTEKIDKNDITFLKHIDSLKFIIKFHPSWNIYKKSFLDNIEPYNITNEQYLDWYHTLVNFNNS